MEGTVSKFESISLKKARFGLAFWEIKHHAALLGSYLACVCCLTTQYTIHRAVYAVQRCNPRSTARAGWVTRM